MILGLLFLALLSHGQENSLPEVRDFYKDLPAILYGTMNAGKALGDQTWEFDSERFRQYTYTETRTTFDSKRATKETETSVYQVVRGLEGSPTYRKQISRNGAPLSEKELQKQDREQEKQEKEARERNSQSLAAPKPDPAAIEKAQNAMTQMLLEIYDVQLVRREVLDGNTTVLLSFKPKPDAKPKGRTMNMMHHATVRAWVTVQDHQVVRSEIEVIDAISFFGAIAKIQPGTLLVFERQKINDEFWAPRRISGTMKGRLLLVKGLNERQVTEYSDFKKYSVETIVKPGTPLEK